MSAQNLIGYLRAEFDKASRLRRNMFFIQLAAAAPPAISVVVPDDARIALYSLAILGAGLVALWWVVRSRYLSVRSAAQASRRAALLIGGLGESLSPDEIQSLRERFTVTSDEARAFEKADYYSTSLPPGPARLGEMIEESALYSEHLQRISANVMLCVVGVFATVFLVIALACAPLVSEDNFLTLVRVFLATLVFAMSADVVGAYQEHRAATREIRDVRQRLRVADRGGYPLADVLMALGDYNAAVEIAPESVPCAYKFSAQYLNQRWEDFQADRAAARSADRAR
jgi:hypothetical protein